jgi:hypothetical protein
MTFRTDGEGPNDRAERLDHELNLAQQALSEARDKRILHLEVELQESRERLDRMQNAIGMLRGAPLHENSPVSDENHVHVPPPGQAPTVSRPLAGFARALPVLLPVGMVAMLGFAIGHGSARRHNQFRPHRPSPAMAAGVAQTVARSSAEGEHSVATRWSAKVKKASGINLSAGSACHIEGDFSAQGGAVTASNVEVWCGDKLVYEKGNYANRTPMISVDEFATDETPSTEGYHLDLEDSSHDSYDKRSQASIDTGARVAVIWRDAAPAFRLELEVNPASVTSEGSDSLFGNNIPRASFAHTTRSGQVVATNGTSGVSNGARCTVEVMPASPRSGWSCRALVRCGDKAIYGEQRTGYGDCSGSGDSLQMHDRGYTMTDGDPKIDADLGKGIVNLSDNDTSNWNVTIKLDR